MAHYRPQLLKLITGIGASDANATPTAVATAANDSNVRQRERWEQQARRHQRRQQRRYGTESGATSDSDAGGRSEAGSDVEAPALTSAQASQVCVCARPCLRTCTLHASWIPGAHVLSSQLTMVQFRILFRLAHLPLLSSPPRPPPRRRRCPPRPPPS